VEQDAAAGRVYNVADDAPLTMSDWVGQLMKIAEWPGRITVIDRPCPPPNLSAAFNTAQHMFMSSSRIRQELGYTELTSRDEALRTTIDWARLHPPEQLDPAQYDYAAEDELVRD
jgi:nucleoside-diphosphate-sugar epimerase